ncbi:NUDIX domain-containing protein [Arenimonas metalli]|uniref:Nudix hydrolase domain-containing protein n=1 Tax=Arenimonas metalli CF5-1 TaxID=1384056 RepID=A0A091ARJ1_9GAMM|nr:NUDIX hydrolase [Arenimonas metalli]KFN41936.1 hypothetical protein N787_04005 [Arenimonas metalli CF5-1]
MTRQAVTALAGSFARKRCSVGALIHDSQGRLLILRPSYRPEWLLPGGVVEEGESPGEALVRELHEEIGLATTVLGLACVDYVPACERFSEAMHFLFHCNALDDATARALRPDGSEIVELLFADHETCDTLLAPTIARRLRSLGAGQPGYLEAGAQRYPFFDRIP